MSSKQDPLFLEDTKGTNLMFNKCNIKIPEFEQQLAPASSAKQISVVPEDDSGYRWKDANDERFIKTILTDLKDREFKILNFNEGKHGSHSIIVIKDVRLPKGWGFFDANGKEGFKDSILRFYDSTGNDSTDAYLTTAPNGAFNPAYFTKSDKPLPKDINPGFCGIFGIIFMAFYIKHRNDPKWIDQWSNISSCLLKPYTPKKGTPYKFSLVVAREVLKIVNGRGGKDTKVNKINDVLDQACAFIGVTPTEPAPQDEEDVLDEIQKELVSPKDIVIEDSTKVSCDDEPSGFSCAIMGGNKRRKRRGTLYVSPKNKPSKPPTYNKEIMGIVKQQVNIVKKLASGKVTKREMKHLSKRRQNLKKQIKQLKKTFKKRGKSSRRK